VATQIIATRKRQHGDHQHVDSILTEDHRTYTRAQAVERILNGWEAFYTEYAGQRAKVFVRDGSCGVSYITTTPDGTTKNNLLHIADF